LTQDGLAKEAGTNQAVIQKIENGKSLRPRLIMEIAEALNVNPAWLQFGEPWAQKERP
jgi:transcriptional regulator with XRE-family HTH domain